MSLVKIIGSEKAKCLTAGMVYEVEAAVAEKLIKKDEAVKPGKGKQE